MDDDGVPPRADPVAVHTWVYPSNFPVREYQRQIVESALLQNTLVCLPTGLGKTLIAAVVMYNFYKWFPTGCIVFMAPTKPLVSQQIAACHSVVGIPETDTAHLDGSVSAEQREVIWSSRRVIFCTPQTLENDMVSGNCDPRRIVCVVFDEAHRATGNYAYTKIVKLMERCNPQYRVLALSATPGRDVRAIQQIIHNLRISAIEVRSEEDEDVQQYVNDKQVEVVQCRSSSEAGGGGGDLMSIRRLLDALARPRVTRLHALGLLTSDSVDRLSDFVLREALEYFERNMQELNNGLPSSQISECRNDFKCVRVCVKWKTQLAGRNNAQSMATLNEINAFIVTMTQLLESRKAGAFKGDEAMVNSQDFQKLKRVVKKCMSSRSISDKSNPKLDKAGEIIEEHVRRYSTAGVSTRVIVFVATRATVLEVVSQLDGVPGLKPVGFVGQASKKAEEDNIASPNSVTAVNAFGGLNQAEQEAVLSRFRAGEVNVLVATCIAEEGLDIGDVDLIVCYDSVSSPLRLMQRMGRTGRKRSGRVVLLVAEGKERQKVDASANAANAVYTALRDAKRTLKFHIGHRVLPDSVVPFLQLQDLNLGSFLDRGKIAGNKVNSRAPADESKAQKSANQQITQWVSRGGHEQSKPREENPVSINEITYAISIPEVQVYSCLICGAADAGPARLCSICEVSIADVSEEAENGLPTYEAFEDEDIFVEEPRQFHEEADMLPPPSIDVRASKLSYSDLISKAREKIVAHLNIQSTIQDIKENDLILTPPDIQVFTTFRSDGDRSGRKPGELSNRIHAPAINTSLIKAYFQRTRRPEMFDAHEASPIATLDHSMMDSEGIELELSNRSEHASTAPTEERCTSGTKTPKIFIMPSFSSDEDSDGDSDVGRSSLPQQSMSSAHVHEEQVSIAAIKTLPEQPLSPTHDEANHIFELDSFLQSTPIPEKKISNLDMFRVPASLNRQPSTASRSVLPPKQATSTASTHTSPARSSKALKCAICTGSKESGMRGRLVQCSGPCKSYVHCACYGLGALGREDRFECEGCWSARMSSTRECCVLCKSPGGLLRMSHQGDAWVHPICVLFTPELTVDDDSLRANNLNKLDPDRAGLCCLICRRTGGSCVQCCHASCLATIHPYCAFRASKQLLIRNSSSEGTQEESRQSRGSASDGSFADEEDEDGDGNERDIFSYEYYCDAHLGKINNTDEVVSSMLPIQYERRNKAVDSSNATSLENSKGAACGNPSDIPKAALQRTPQKGSSIAKRSLSQLLSIEDVFGSPLAVAGESPVAERKRLKKMRHVLQEASAEAFSEQHQHHNDEEERSKRVLKKKNPKLRDVNWRFLDVEAALDSEGSSASEDEDVGDSDEEKLSGDFINDGDYTQASPGLDTGVAMYMAVNRNMTQSPDFYNVKKMLGSRAGRRKSIKSARSPDESVRSFSSPDEFDQSFDGSIDESYRKDQSVLSEDSDFASPEQNRGFAEEWLPARQSLPRQGHKSSAPRQGGGASAWARSGFGLPSSSSSSSDSDDDEKKKSNEPESLQWKSRNVNITGPPPHGVLTAAAAAQKLASSKKRPMKL